MLRSARRKPCHSIAGDAIKLVNDEDKSLVSEESPKLLEELRALRRDRLTFVFSKSWLKALQRARVPRFSKDALNLLVNPLIE